MSGTKCERNHEMMKRNPLQWIALELVGYQVTPADEFGPYEKIELRNCTCGNTLALDVTSSPA